MYPAIIEINLASVTSAGLALVIPAIFKRESINYGVDADPTLSSTPHTVTRQITHLTK